jgi:hypothetical protein
MMCFISFDRCSKVILSSKEEDIRKILDSKTRDDIPIISDESNIIASYQVRFSAFPSFSIAHKLIAGLLQLPTENLPTVVDDDTSALAEMGGYESDGASSTGVHPLEARV